MQQKHALVGIAGFEPTPCRLSLAMQCIPGCTMLLELRTTTVLPLT